MGSRLSRKSRRNWGCTKCSPITAPTRTRSTESSSWTSICLSWMGCNQFSRHLLQTPVNKCTDLHWAQDVAAENWYDWLLPAFWPRAAPFPGLVFASKQSGSAGRRGQNKNLLEVNFRFDAYIQKLSAHLSTLLFLPPDCVRPTGLLPCRLINWKHNILSWSRPRWSWIQRFKSRSRSQK